MYSDIAIDMKQCVFFKYTLCDNKQEERKNEKLKYKIQQKQKE